MSTAFTITNNEQQQQFEIHYNNSLAFLVYRFYNNSIALMHTEVPESMEGHGAASALAEYAFKFAKENNKPVLVYCPFVSTYLKRHPELNDQLDKGFQR